MKAAARGKGDEGGGKGEGGGGLGSTIRPVKKSQ